MIHFILPWTFYCELPEAKKIAFDKLHFLKGQTVNFEQVSCVFVLDHPEMKPGEVLVVHTRIMLIFATNNFQTQSGLRGSENCSHVKHSCVPNVHHFAHPTRQKQTFHAVRCIHAGEDLLMTNLGVRKWYFPNAQHRDALCARYGFIRICVACTDVSGSSEHGHQAMNCIGWGLKQ